MGFLDTGVWRREECGSTRESVFIPSWRPHNHINLLEFERRERWGYLIRGSSGSWFRVVKRDCWSQSIRINGLVAGLKDQLAAAGVGTDSLF